MWKTELEGALHALHEQGAAARPRDGQVGRDAEPQGPALRGAGLDLPHRGGEDEEEDGEGARRAYTGAREARQRLQFQAHALRVPGQRQALREGAQDRGQPQDDPPHQAPLRRAQGDREGQALRRRRARRALRRPLRAGHPRPGQPPLPPHPAHARLPRVLRDERLRDDLPRPAPHVRHHDDRGRQRSLRSLRVAPSRATWATPTWP